MKLLGEGNLNPSHSYQFDANARNRFPESGKASQVSRRAPEGQHKVTLDSVSSSRAPT